MQPAEVSTSWPLLPGEDLSLLSPFFPSLPSGEGEEEQRTGSEDGGTGLLNERCSGINSMAISAFSVDFFPPLAWPFERQGWTSFHCPHVIIHAAASFSMTAWPRHSESKLNSWTFPVLSFASSVFDWAVSMEWASSVFVGTTNEQMC